MPMSGSSAVRLSVVTASARTLPLSICGFAGDTDENIICTWPAMMSCNAGPVPL